MFTRFLLLASLSVSLSCEKQLNCNEFGLEQITCKDGMYSLNSTCNALCSEDLLPEFDIVTEGAILFAAPFILWTVYTDSSCYTVADNSPYINSTYVAILNTCLKADYYNAKAIQVFSDSDSQSPHLVGFIDSECIQPAESFVELKLNDCIPYHGYYQKFTLY